MLNHRAALILVLAALILTACAYLPSLSNGFTNWDDYVALTENSQIKTLSWKNTLHYFSDLKHTGSDFYKPLVLLSYAVEYHFFGLDPRIYHFTNLLLHLANTGLVFYLVLLLGQTPFVCFAVAALFGVHPMHVESVAWVTQRKDVLYAFFFILSLIYYLLYRKSSKAKDYVISVCFFILSLMSKPMAVTLAPVLFLFDYLEKRPLDRRMFAEKIPFFVAAFMFGMLLLLTSASPLDFTPAMKFPDNFLTMSDALVFYIKKLFIPINLSCFYAIPVKSGNILPGLPSSPILLLGSALLIFLFGRRSRSLVFGVLFFLLTLLPTLRLAPALTLAADHYTYIPYFGLFYVAALWMGLFVDNPGSIYRKYFVAFVFGLILIALGCLTWQRCGVWKDSETLWKDVLQKYHEIKESPEAAVAKSQKICYLSNVAMTTAYINLGCYYSDRGDYEAAIAAFDDSLRFCKDYSLTLSKRANAYSQIGQGEKALADAESAIRAVENEYQASLKRRGKGEVVGDALWVFYRDLLAKAYIARGLEHSARGREERAVTDYNEAILLCPGKADPYNNRGHSYAKQEDYVRAIADYRRALEISPGFELAQANLEMATNFPGKIAQLTREIEKMPAAGSYCDRGIYYAKLHNFQKALPDLDRAIALDPLMVRAFKNRGSVYQVMHDDERALADYKNAFALDPLDPILLRRVYYQQALILSRNGRKQESMRAYRRFEELADQKGI